MVKKGFIGKPARQEDFENVADELNKIIEKSMLYILKRAVDFTWKSN